MFSAKDGTEHAKTSVHEIAMDFVERLESRRKVLNTLSKGNLIKALECDLDFAPAQISRWKIQDLKTKYLQLFADGNHETEDAAISSAEEDEDSEQDPADPQETENQTLTDAFGFATPAYGVARKFAEQKDTEKKALIFRKNVKLGSDCSGIGAAECAGNHITSGSKRELVIELQGVCENDSKALMFSKAYVFNIAVRFI